MLPCRASAGARQYLMERRTRARADRARVTVVAHPARGYTLPRSPAPSDRVVAGAGLGA